MYLLDTNVLSEVMRDRPNEAVADWLRACPPDALSTAAICQAEIFYCVGRMAHGAKRNRLMIAAHALFERQLKGRVLPFDEAAATAYAALRIERERQGRPIRTEDGMIAAITRVGGMSVVTRDGSGFAGCGVPVINPWTD